MAILFQTFKNLELDEAGSQTKCISKRKKCTWKRGKKQKAWTHVERRPTAIYTSYDVNMLVQTHRTLWSMPCPMRAACRTHSTRCTCQVQIDWILKNSRQLWWQRSACTRLLSISIVQLSKWHGSSANYYYIIQCIRSICCSELIVSGRLIRWKETDGKRHRQFRKHYCAQCARAISICSERASKMIQKCVAINESSSGR